MTHAFNTTIVSSGAAAIVGRTLPVDDGRRKMEKQIDEARFGPGLGEEPIEQPGGFRPDAGQCGDATEDGIEQGGTHEGSVQLAGAEQVT